MNVDLMHAHKIIASIPQMRILETPLSGIVVSIVTTLLSHFLNSLISSVIPVEATFSKAEYVFLENDTTASVMINVTSLGDSLSLTISMFVTDYFYVY